VSPASGQADWVRAVAFTPDGRRVLTGSDDELLCVWDAATGALGQRFEAGAGSVLAVAITPDVQRVLAGCEDGTIAVWRLR
jgi:WD40 repeat protein